MQIKPVGDYILLKVEEVENKSGLHLPNQDKHQCRVIGCKPNDDFKEGDLVMFNGNEGHVRELNNGKYILIKAEHILGVIEEEK